MARIPLNEAPIHVWRPMSDGQPFIARISRLPMFFEASTAIGAKKAAEKWVAEELAKEQARKDRAAARSNPRGKAAA